MGRFCTLRQSSVRFAGYRHATLRTLLSQLRVFLCFYFHQTTRFVLPGPAQLDVGRFLKLGSLSSHRNEEVFLNLKCGAGKQLLLGVASSGEHFKTLSTRLQTLQIFWRSHYIFADACRLSAILPAHLLSLESLPLSFVLSQRTAL
jgi:hypothetical protein